MKTLATLIALTISVPCFADGLPKQADAARTQKSARATDDWGGNDSQGEDDKGADDVKGGDVKGADDGRTQRTQRTQGNYDNLPSNGRVQREATPGYPNGGRGRYDEGYGEREGGRYDRRGPVLPELCAGVYEGNYADGTPVEVSFRPSANNQIGVVVHIGNTPYVASGVCLSNGGEARFKFTVNAPNTIEHTGVIRFVRSGALLEGQQILMGPMGIAPGVPFQLRSARY